jgi:hypothetical protein
MIPSRSTVPAFDIFRIDGATQPIWQEAAETMEDATMRVRQLGASLPGKYLIHSQKTSIEISIEVTPPKKLTGWFSSLPKVLAVRLRQAR